MSTLALLGVLSSAIFSGTSLLYATLGEIITQRSGVINLGLEGTLLISASVGFAVTHQTGNPYLGVLAAMLAGGLANMILAWLVVNRHANQLASGLALMFFSYGLSAMIGKPYVGGLITGLPRIAFPGTASLPRMYASLFRFDILIYLAVPLAIIVWFALFRTRWGLGLRAVGEHTDAAFSSGRNPKRIRYQALFIGGMLAGLGAAHLSIAYTKTWAEYMTAGRGFIAIALVIFARWHPIRAISGALIFSGAVALQLLLQSSGVQISPLLLDTLPYIITLVVLILWGGTKKQTTPASLGRIFKGSE